MKEINESKILRGQLHTICNVTAENTGKVIDIEIATRYLNEFAKIMNGMAKNEPVESDAWFYADKAITAYQIIEDLINKSIKIQGDSISLDRAANQLKKSIK